MPLQNWLTSGKAFVVGIITGAWVPKELGCDALVDGKVAAKLDLSPRNWLSA